MKNLQGDIIAIVDEKGQTIVEYSYDAWGNVTFSESSLQNMTKASTLCFVSPFTYRGYCYDYDIELYYLQSRYYSAEIGRFINTDDTQIAIETQGEILGANLFAYCNNNPVMNVDYTGCYGISNLLSIFNQSLGLLQNIIELIANSCAKDLNNLKNSLKRLTKKQKNYAKLLDDVVKESNKLAKKIGKIGKIITLVTVVIGLIEVLNKGAKKIYAFAKLFAELCTEAVTAFASKICGSIAAKVPGFGFILNVLVSFGVSHMLSRYFTDSRISKIADRIHNSIKNMKTINKSNLFKAILKSTFA